jgi:5-methylthioadenosine/S-adenosylhomocysteine deaminase
MTTATTVIRGGTLLDPAGLRARPADILVEGETIREIGAPGLKAPEAARPLDARDRLLIPGLINAHTHSHGALARGIVPDAIPLEILLGYAGAVNGNRTLEDKHLSAQLSAIELVRKGCTACYDMFTEFPAPTVEGVHAVARAYREVGVRAVVAPMMADLTLWQALPGLLASLPDGLRRRVEGLRATPGPASAATCRDILKAWPTDRSEVAPGLGPTIPLHCSDGFLAACRDLAREFEVGIQMHLAESRGQAVLGVEKYGASLTTHLDGLGLVGPRFSGAHGVWLEDEDIRRLAGAGASVAHNPMSNLRLGSGVARVRAMLKAGLRIGLGTDSASSSDTQNMFEAVRLCAYLSRVQTFDYREWITAGEAFTLATEGSAGVLGMDRIGRLVPGFKADIVFLDLSRTGWVPLNDALLQLVNGESGAAVDSVMVGGRLVLEHGRLLTVDEAKIRAEAERTAERLRTVNAESYAFARALAEHIGAFCLRVTG